MHLCAYFESINSATLVRLDTINDDVLTRSGADRFFVPPELPNILWAAAMGTDLTRAQIVSPSLQARRANLEVLPRQRGAELWTLGFPEIFLPLRPITLAPTEELEFQAAEDNSSSSVVYGLIALAPASLPAPPAGDVIAVRATGTTTLVADAWTTCTLTPDSTLPPGQYACIGFVPISATGIAARMLINQQVWRPGMPVMGGTEAAAAEFNDEKLRQLMNYNYGAFSHINFPQFQFLASAADTAETVIMYVVRTGNAS